MGEGGHCLLTQPAVQEDLLLQSESSRVRVKVRVRGNDGEAAEACLALKESSWVF